MITDPILLTAISAQASLLTVPDNTEPRSVLSALTYCETNWGELAKAARYEPAYYRGGRYYLANSRLVHQYEALAACSWGPYQMMYPTAWEFGFRGDPWELVNADLATRLAIAYLNKRVVGPTGPASYADAWNSGTNRDTIIPGPYMAKFMDGYQQALTYWSAAP